MASATTTSSKGGFFDSSIGLKFIMAITGICLVAFVVLHLLGNLQIFIGPEPFNRYAQFLQGLGGLLWLARIGLLLMFVLHLVSGLKLRKMNATARPVGYTVKRHVKTSFASATMLETGLLIFAFVLFHLAHFTLGILQPEYYHLSDAQGRHDVYRMVILGFGNGFYSGSYAFLMVMLGLHLSHAIPSVFQTLGFNHPRYSPLIERGGSLLAWVLALGYISIPVAIYFGFVR